MNGLLSIIGMQAELDYLIGDFPACFGDIPLAIPKGNISSDKQKYQPKEKHEFTIKGIKIIVASKKNATKQVTGNLLDETGTDGEPLIKNVKILKKL